ncbi:hypothetical protein V5O48_018432 [Marasmius crinis-equi]|uniref:Uncharacterized protein n=1 Tax=Marasmius crinis-equi TaxID=585013 RepID=A0ABR3ELD4_9AGAR
MTCEKTPEALERRAKNRLHLARLDSKLHRERGVAIVLVIALSHLVLLPRNKAEYNAKARERMARKRATMSEDKRTEYLLKQRTYSQKYYERNRDTILDKADAKRYQEYEAMHGRDSFNRNYRFRNVKPRVLLKLQKDSEEYKTGLDSWREEKTRRLEELKSGKY